MVDYNLNPMLEVLKLLIYAALALSIAEAFRRAITGK